MNRSRTPGPDRLGSLLLAIRLLKDPRVVLMGYTRRYGEVWRSLIPLRGAFRPFRSMFWLMGPEGNERVLAPAHKDDFTWYEGYRLTMEPLFGRDILLLLDDTEEVPAHRLRKRVLMAPLSARWDEESIPVMRDIILGYIRRYQDGQVIDLGHEIKRITFHIVSHLLLGAEAADQEPLYHLFEELGLGLFSPLRLSFPGSRFHRGLLARRRLGAFLLHKIAAHRRSGAPAPGLLGQMMSSEAGPPLPDETLVGEMLAFLFAGYDTTSSMLLSFFVCLAGRPDIYEEVRREALALSGYSYSEMQDLPLQEAALLETERLYPPLLFLLRGAARDIEFAGHEIDRGSLVVYSPYYTGRAAAAFDRPGEYRPERFLDGKRPPPYTLIGFGAGHRSCIGKRFALLEMRLFINLLLKRVSLSFLPQKDDEVFFNPTLQRRHGYQVLVHVRRGRDGS